MPPTNPTAHYTRRSAALAMQLETMRSMVAAAWAAVRRVEALIPSSDALRHARSEAERRELRYHQLATALGALRAEVAEEAGE
jgi:hypothetical protein